MKRDAAYLLAVFAVSSMAAPIGAQQQRTVDHAALVEAPAAEWLTYGRDYQETRYSPLNQINTENLDRLGLAWSWDLPGGGGIQATPLVSNGVMYSTGGGNLIFALDAGTGEMLWQWDPAHATGSRGNGPRSGPNRGLALYDGKVYAGLVDGRLVALDIETGQPVWSQQTTPYGVWEYNITGAPRVYDGKVIIGNGGAEYHGVRGFVTAYDAQTGELAWRFWIVPGDPSLPFEHPEMEYAAQTWAGEWWKYGGGGTAWDSFSYDPDTNIVYIGTGNGAPWSHYWRSDGVGDNLFLNSIVALDMDTGEMVWYYQAVPADNWDYTTTQQMTLVDLVVDGVERPVLMTATKQGFYYLLDRVTGELLVAEPFVYTNWAESYDMETGRPILTDVADYDTTGAWISPGGAAWGGANWYPQSWHPNTGLLYVPGQETATYYQLEADFEPLYGQFSTGTTRSIPEGAPPPPDFGQPGFLLALDPATGEERWRIRYDQVRNGGTLTTGENLLFSTRRDGWLYAKDATTGERLWEHEIGPAPVSPITYELDGVQYISILSGSAAGGAIPARVWTFALDGNAPVPSED